MLSVNGTSLDTVEHSDAIRLLKESGNAVELVVKRKLLVPNPLDGQPTKVMLQKRNKRDGRFLFTVEFSHCVICFHGLPMLCMSSGIARHLLTF